MKTNKHQTLRLARIKGPLRAQDIVSHFDYSSGTARSYLSYLARQGLLVRTVRGYILSCDGEIRLQYFDAMECGSFDCPICCTKTVNHYTCPRCQYQLKKKKARTLPRLNFILGVRHPGVYCPLCQKLIFSEKQAQLLGIPKED